MKRILLFAAIIFTASTAMAQGVEDALRFSEQKMEGTARSAAMGNALVALGGDLGGIAINPASTGVYRYSEFVMTPSVTNYSSSVNYLGTATSDNKTRFGISNFGFVGTVNTGRQNAGLVSWSVGISLTKQNNFTSTMKAFGTTNSTSRLGSIAVETSGTNALNMDITDTNHPFYTSNASWNSILAWNTSLLDTLPGTNSEYIGATENLNGSDISVGGNLNQMYRSQSVGNVTDVTINWGGNIANKLFIGFNMGIQSIYYKYDETYAEDAHNSNNFQTGFEHFAAAYRHRVTGTGLNFKAGLIYVPVEWLRLGASVSTPTWTYLSEEWENAMESSFNDGYSQKLVSPLGVYDYELTSPFRWNVGAAVMLPGIGVLSADYENVNYSHAELIDPEYGFGYTQENNEIKQTLTSADILRIGAEVNVNPAFALRAGYQNYSSPYAKGLGNSTHIGAFGFGYNTECGGGNFFIDLTWQQMLKKNTENFALYSDTDIAAPAGTNKTSNWRLLLSLGLRF